jgi:hypothetical protein
VNLFWRDLGHDQKGEYISPRLLKIASAMTMRASLGSPEFNAWRGSTRGWHWAGLRATIRLLPERSVRLQPMPWEVRFLALPARS